MPVRLPMLMNLYLYISIFVNVFAYVFSSVFVSIFVSVFVSVLVELVVQHACLSSDADESVFASVFAYVFVSMFVSVFLSVLVELVCIRRWCSTPVRLPMLMNHRQRRCRASHEQALGKRASQHELGNRLCQLFLNWGVGGGGVLKTMTILYDKYGCVSTHDNITLFKK